MVLVQMVDLRSRLSWRPLRKNKREMSRDGGPVGENCYAQSIKSVCRDSVDMNGY